MFNVLASLVHARLETSPEQLLPLASDEVCPISSAMWFEVPQKLTAFSLA